MESNNNPGDWWTQLESDTSSGSNTQIHQTLVRGHEMTSSLLQLEMAQGLNRGEHTSCFNMQMLYRRLRVR